jgi:hypothetical protein
VHQGRVDLRVGGQPTVGRPRDHHGDRRAVGHLVAQLPGDAEAAGRGRLAVQDEQVDVVRVDEPDALAVGGSVDELDL